ncbi:MAG: SAF domain-containing protein, partial [Dehalococcoidia bacterium]
LESQGLQRLIRYIRTVEVAKGSPEKQMIESEAMVRQRLAKSLTARQHIPKGTLIIEGMLAIKGPGVGLKPSLMNRVVGKVAQVDIREDTLIPIEALEW